MQLLERYPASAARFVRSLYEEHCEEAAFLHLRLRYMQAEGTFEARELSALSERIAVQMLALAAGGALALEVCEARANDKHTADDGHRATVERLRAALGGAR
jgi:hypothetical protein